MGGVCGLIKGRVSVVTPVYNGEGHVGRLLESVLAQTWDEIEMILVDDGSTDGTLAVAKTYMEKFRARGFRYRIVTAEHNNASAAINGGLPLVTGEFLIWPDSDDTLEPDSVRKRAEFLQARPEYQCVRSLSYYVDEAGKRTAADERRGDLQNERLFFPILEGETFVCCGCYMLRTERFFEIYRKRQIPEYEVGQNFQMLLPFMYFYPCHTIQEELYVVHVRPESHSRQVLTLEQQKAKYAAYEKMVDVLAGVCGIYAAEERRKIRNWKCRRRLRLYREYGVKYKAIAALFRLLLGRGIGFYGCIKQVAWICCGERLRRFYRRFSREGKPDEEERSA